MALSRDPPEDMAQRRLLAEPPSTRCQRAIAISVLRLRTLRPARKMLVKPASIMVMVDASDAALPSMVNVIGASVESPSGVSKLVGVNVMISS
jgi:hypothetical protein